MENGIHKVTARSEPEKNPGQSNTVSRRDGKNKPKKVMESLSKEVTPKNEGKEGKLGGKEKREQETSRKKWRLHKT